MTETAQERPTVKSMTTAKIKDELRERGVEFPTTASKKDLSALLEQTREQEKSEDAPETPPDDDVIDGTVTDEEIEHEHAHSNADIAVREKQAPMRQEFTERERELIARVVAPGHTADELALFERICIRTGLDPFARQIYSIKRNRRRKVNDQWISEEVAQTQTGIDGFRLIAHRTGQYQGQTPPEWYDQDAREWVPVWLSDKNPPAARVGVYRRGFATPLIRTVTWREFGSDKGQWKTMPAHMLAKCAESQALRAAFPQELSGLYTEEEMGQADEPVTGASYQTAMEPIRKEEAGDNAPPRNVHDILTRLVAQLGEEEAVEWLREAVALYSEHKGSPASGWAELTPQLKNDLGQRLAGVVVDLEERQAETAEDLRMSTKVREKVVPIFGKRLDGIALRGPQWRLGPDEEDRPTLQEYTEAESGPVDDDLDIPFPGGDSGSDGGV